MGKQYTVTVEIEAYTVTGNVRVTNGDAHGQVTIVGYEEAEDSWIEANDDKITAAVMEAAENVAQSEEDEKNDRGFDLYDDEDGYGGEEFGGAFDDIWG
jgi:hypothetical protein